MILFQKLPKGIELLCLLLHKVYDVLGNNHYLGFSGIFNTLLRQNIT